MKKIIIGTSLDPLSAGDMAELISAVKMIKNQVPDIVFTILVYSSPENMQRYYGLFLKKYDIKVITAPWCDRHGKPRFITKVIFLLHSLPLSFVRRGLLRDYDLYIELGTDQHTTEFLGYGHFYASLYLLTLCIFSRKPFMIIGASVGPFMTHLSCLVAKLVFSRANLITVREKISMKYLHGLVNTQNLYLTADPAFNLEPATTMKIEELSHKKINTDNIPLVGISPSDSIWLVGFPDIRNRCDKQRVYIGLMARLSDFIIDNLSVRIVFIPRIMPHDRSIIEKIQQKMRHEQMTNIYGSSDTTDEQAGIISKCQLFIACRLHSAVASVSAGVPTIILSYSHKFPGVLSPFLDVTNINDIRANCTPDELYDQICKQIKYMWLNKEEISRYLKGKMPEIKEKGLLNAILVKKALLSLNNKTHQFNL